MIVKFSFKRQESLFFIFQEMQYALQITEWLDWNETWSNVQCSAIPQILWVVSHLRSSWRLHWKGIPGALYFPHPFPLTSPPVMISSDIPWSNLESVFLYFNPLARILGLRDSKNLSNPTLMAFKHLATINSCPTLLIPYCPNQTSSFYMYGQRGPHSRNYLDRSYQSTYLFFSMMKVLTNTLE